MIDHLRAPLVALAFTTACGGKDVGELAATIHLKVTEAISEDGMNDECGTTEGDFDVAANFAKFSGSKRVEDVCPEGEEQLDAEACGTIGEEIISVTEGRIGEEILVKGENLSDEWNGLQISAGVVTDNFEANPLNGCLQYSYAFLKLGEDIEEPGHSESSDELSLEVDCTWGPYEVWDITDITDMSFQRLDCSTHSSTWGGLIK